MIGGCELLPGFPSSSPSSLRVLTASNPFFLEGRSQEDQKEENSQDKHWFFFLRIVPLREQNTLIPPPPEKAEEALFRGNQSGYGSPCICYPRFFPFSAYSDDG